MGVPILELIAETLFARLGQINQDNGYNNDIANLVRPTRLGDYTPEDRLLVLQQGDAVRDVENTSDFESITWLQTFFILCFRAPSDRDPTPIDRAVNLLRADVEAALCKDVRSYSDDPPAGAALWYLLGDLGQNLAVGAHLDNPINIENDDASVAGVIVNFVVRYTVSNVDPTQLA